MTETREIEIDAETYHRLRALARSLDRRTRTIDELLTDWTSSISPSSVEMWGWLGTCSNCGSVSSESTCWHCGGDVDGVYLEPDPGGQNADYL